MDLNLGGFVQCESRQSEAEVTQSCLTLCSPMDYTVHVIP